MDRLVNRPVSRNVEMVVKSLVAELQAKLLVHDRNSIRSPVGAGLTEPPRALRGSCSLNSRADDSPTHRPANPIVHGFIGTAPVVIPSALLVLDLQLLGRQGINYL